MRINVKFYRSDALFMPYRIENNPFVVMNAPHKLASECKGSFS